MNHIDQSHLNQQKEVERLNALNEKQRQIITRQHEKIQRLQHELNCYKGGIKRIKDEIAEKLKNIPFDEAIKVPSDGTLPQKGDIPLFKERFDNTLDPRTFFYRIYKNYFDVGINIPCTHIRKVDPFLYKQMFKVASDPVVDPELLSFANKYNVRSKKLNVGDKVVLHTIFFDTSELI